MTQAEPLVHLSAVVKNYGALRPLRLKDLSVHAGERVAVFGIDAPGAEMFVNLVTGAILPDEGSVHAFGRNTADIASGDDWIASLDRFGIVSDRAVLLEGSTLAQNLALPFTLSIDPIDEEVMGKVTALAAECGIAAAQLLRQAGSVEPAMRARAHVARALALGPGVLILEHPTAAVPERERGALAADIAAACAARGVAALAITQDEPFARAFAHRRLVLNAATGELKEKKKGWW